MYSLREMMKIKPEAFQSLSVPDNFSIENFCALLRMEKGSLSVVDPENFVDNVHDFFRIQRVNIEQLAKIYKDYESVSPLENYDRIEDTVNESESTGSSAETAVDTDTFKDTVRSKGNGKATTKSRVHGNIGVSTASDMATKHSQYFMNNNMYRQVANLFSVSLCICCYPVILEGVNSVW